MIPATEYEVVYSGALERDLCERIRAAADYALPRRPARTTVSISHTGERVLKYLALFPGITAGHLAIALGLDPSTVRHALASLCKAGFVQPSHKQSENPALHIRWRVI